MKLNWKNGFHGDNLFFIFYEALTLSAEMWEWVKEWGKKKMYTLCYPALRFEHPPLRALNLQSCF